MTLTLTLIALPLLNPFEGSLLSLFSKQLCLYEANDQSEHTTPHLKKGNGKKLRSRTPRESEFP